MGCSETRNSQRPEELVLIETQEALGFSKHNSAYIDQIIRKYSANKQVNERQLELIRKELDIATANYAQYTRITEAFDKLRGPTGINLKYFLVLGILSGQGTDEEKAQLLFEAYDEHYFEEITEADLGVLVTDLLFVVVDCLGHLSSDQTVEAYISVIMKGILRYKEFLKNCLKLSDPCTKLSFIEAWQHLEPLTLSPPVLRSSMYQQASKVGLQKIKAGAGGIFSALKKKVASQVTSGQVQSPEGLPRSSQEA
jgi:Ca2+-binding EF-hand superfamily protein